MAVRPLGHRVLVQPDTQPDRTDSGIVLLTDDREHVPVSGTVVALGPGGPQMRYRARQQAITDCLLVLEKWAQTFQHPSSLSVAKDDVAHLLGTADPVRELAIGDRVVFPAEAGYSLTEDGVRYLVLNEDDVVAMDAATESTEVAA